MKLFIASDLHGSEYYVNHLIDRWQEERPCQTLLLGDYLYHGPRNDLPTDYHTKKTAAYLNALAPAPLCVRGNCDGEVDQRMLDFPILTEQAVIFTEGRKFFLTHGHHLDELKPLLQEGNVVLSGHTHIPCFKKENGIYYVNPGSVSIPKGGSEASYLTYESGVFRWKRVETGEIVRTETLL